MIRDDVEAPFLLMSAFRGLVDAVHSGLADEGFPGVRATHGFALQAIGDGCTSVDLAARLGVSKQAATKTAQSLEALGLIERTLNEHDRRERIITINSRGRTLLALSAAGFRREMAAWRSTVGDHAVDTTLQTLAAIGTDGRADTNLSDWA
ncbi:MarR family transcriptional regulator [Gordonia spumicola]|uniref:MarR family transcriptional regulator n=1 Tax=Gordonia spumicola TaxID=589161 RepID=A0A7I9V688_9ACTN|nr:helix-turn-helix domain-containing protein [Gordonia spumicola]GEE00888.1 MarR family transcriptional regulator [Gordonia spumicola]